MKKAVILSIFLILVTMTVFAEGIAVLKPAGGDVWTIGSTQVITWKFVSADPQPVRIMLFRDFTLVGIIAKNVACESVDGACSFKWQVGNLVPSKEYVLEQTKRVPAGKGYHIGVKVVDTAINGESQAFIIE